MIRSRRTFAHFAFCAIPRVAPFAGIAGIAGIAGVTGIAAIAASATFAGDAGAAPKNTKRCIDNAESGQQSRAAGKLIDAREAFASCTATECPAPIRKDCARWMDELDEATPTYSVKLEDETGVEVATGTVKIDGQLLIRSADGRATPIDPGTHHFVWARDSGGEVAEDVVIREGERNKIVLLHAPLPDGSVATVTTTSSGETKTVITPPARSPLPWILGGAGVVLGGVGATFWGIGLSERSSLQSGCAGAGTCTDSQVSTSRTKLEVGDVLVGVGILAVAGAVYFLVKDHAGGDHPAKTASFAASPSGSVTAR